MPASAPTTDPSPDLPVGKGARPGWNQPDRRRRAFHNMHTVFRYSLGLRAPEVLRPRKLVDRRIGDLPSVRRLTGTGYFSGMLANPDTGVVVVFFSVLENADAYDPAYSAEVIRMAEEITRLPA